MVNRQTGISLVELLITLALGVIMIGAALQSMLGSRSAFLVTQELSQVQENGRFALEILGRDVRMAGYPPKYSQPTSIDERLSQLPFLVDSCSDGAGVPNAAVCTVDGSTVGTGNDANGRPNSDQFAILIDPEPDDGTETDCTGATLLPIEQVANVYYVADTDGDGVFSLMCRGWSTTDGAWNQNSTAQPLIDGIENMQVLYGVNNGETNGVSGYISANEINLDPASPPHWGQVEAVRIGLLASAGVTQGIGDPIPKQYVLLDSGLISYHLDANGFVDNFNRQIYTATYTLNNALAD